MALDPEWVWAMLATAEVAAVRQMILSFRAPSRFGDRHQDVLRAKADGYSGPVTKAVGALIECVNALREPRHETEDGAVPPPPVGDVLARAEVNEELDAVTSAFESAVDARRCARRCRCAHFALGIVLIPVVLLIPVPLWPHLDEKANDDLLSGANLHVADTLLGVAAIASIVLFAMTIWAENSLKTSLDAHKPDHARLGA